MSDLLGMSFDSSASPSIRLSAWGDGKGVPKLVQKKEADGHPAPPSTGWGFGWYPVGEAAAVVVKDPMPTGDTPLSRVLRDWERFRSTVFLCHIRGAARRVSQEDTHPFLRSYAGRDWLLAHNGQLDMGKVRAHSLGEPPLFEPVGRTDSEYLLCWLLTQLHRSGQRRLADIGWPQLHEWFRAFDELGTLNLVITDGHDLVAYRDAEGFNSLHALRRKPPHETSLLKNQILSLDFGDPQDINRTMVLFATTPVSEEAWEPLEAGEMMVARRGEITWRSSDSNAATRDRALSSLPSPVAPSQSGDLARDTNPPPPLMRTSSIQPLAHHGVMPQAEAVAPASRIATVTHETSYTYKEAVEQSAHVFRLKPVEDATQRILEHTLTVEPGGESYSFEDVFGNPSTNVRIRLPYKELKIISRSRVRITADPPVAKRTRRTSIPLVWMPWQRQMMLPYLLPPELPETQLRELSDFAMSFVERQDHDLVETLRDINTSIRRDFAYVSESTTLETTPFDVYVTREGVCQDFANLFICLARLLGVPARYRTGYIYTGANYDNKIQSDASHAWVEVYLPWAGWRGYDPTNGCLANLDHLRIAAGRNYRDATPTSGTIYKGGAGEKLKVAVRFEVEDDPMSA